MGGLQTGSKWVLGRLVAVGLPRVEGPPPPWPHPVPLGCGCHLDQHVRWGHSSPGRVGQALQRPLGGTNGNPNQNLRQAKPGSCSGTLPSRDPVSVAPTSQTRVQKGPFWAPKWQTFDPGGDVAPPRWSVGPTITISNGADRDFGQGCGQNRQSAF